MPMIGIDPQSVNDFRHTLLLTLPDLTTKVNYFDDLNKNMYFSVNRLRVLHKLFTHIWISANWICDGLDQLRMDF